MPPPQRYNNDNDDDDDDDDYCFVKYGTPLDPLEEDEIPQKRPNFIEDQIVKDKQGRRRFHGAFTGGFSAGFFNTVGSLEGWAPSSFKSSKSEKRKVSLQKPEDFMDEEDTNEFGIAPLVLKTRKDYASFKGSSSQHQSKESNVEAFLFHNLLRPVRETIGIKLLGKMGWKPGQGVGPRNRKRDRKKISKFREKAYGCQPLPQFRSESERLLKREEEKEEVVEESDSDSDSSLVNVTFAPNDYETFMMSPKDNFFGIGYQGLPKNAVLGLSKIKPDMVNFSLDKSKKKLKISGQAFGVGAFEDEDDDIYAKEDWSQYDFVLTGESSKEEALTGRKPLETSSINSNSIDGFTSQRLQRNFRRQYQLPKLPKNFKCQHKIEKSRFECSDEANPNPLMSQQSVTEKMESLQRLNAENSMERSSTAKIPSVASSSNNISFKLFIYDPDKQERFENYLKHGTLKGKSESNGHLQLANKRTEWDDERERLEFAQAARLLKPLSETLETRFLPARQSDDLSDPLAVVEKFSPENDDVRNAAKLKMFGSLTRTIDEWLPTGLLSKRFNVPELKNSENHQSGGRDANPKFKNSKEVSFFSALTSAISSDSDAFLETSAKGKPDEDKKNENENENEKEKKNDGERSRDECAVNKVDLFKAIFLDSDSEPMMSSDDDRPDFEETLKNDKRNSSPPRGIFENIDFKALNSGRGSGDRPVVVEDLEPTIEDVTSGDIYGPRIPDGLIPGRERGLGGLQKENRNDVQSLPTEAKDDFRWVEKKLESSKPKKDKKREKKKSKNKKSKHKGKHKKRKK